MTDCTRFWLLRHALVQSKRRVRFYGRMDVALCDVTLAAQSDAYRAIARRLPAQAAWYVTPLSRTLFTAAAIGAAGYEMTAAPEIEPGLIEQDLGEWQGLPHEELPERLQEPAHAFWPLGAKETPPGGESMAIAWRAWAPRWKRWRSVIRGRMWLPSVMAVPSRSAGACERRGREGCAAFRHCEFISHRAGAVRGRLADCLRE